MSLATQEFTGNETVIENPWVETVSGWRWINTKHGLEIERKSGHPAIYELYKVRPGRPAKLEGIFEFVAEAMAWGC